MQILMHDDNNTNFPEGKWWLFATVGQCNGNSKDLWLWDQSSI